MYNVCCYLHGLVLPSNIHNAPRVPTAENSTMIILPFTVMPSLIKCTEHCVENAKV